MLQTAYKLVNRLWVEGTRLDLNPMPMRSINGGPIPRCTRRIKPEVEAANHYRALETLFPHEETLLSKPSSRTLGYSALSKTLQSRVNTTTIDTTKICFLR